MRRYHIMFRLGSHGVATGKNYETTDEIKALRKTAKELVSKCDDAALLEQIIEQLN